MSYQYIQYCRYDRSHTVDLGQYKPLANIGTNFQDFRPKFVDSFTIIVKYLSYKVTPSYSNLRFAKHNAHSSTLTDNKQLVILCTRLICNYNNLKINNLHLYAKKVIIFSAVWMAKKQIEFMQTITCNHYEYKCMWTTDQSKPKLEKVR